MPAPRIPATLAFLAVLFSAASLVAAVLQVDLGATGQSVQTDFEAMTQVTSATLTSPLSNGTTIAVGLARVGQDIDWRDRAEVSGVLGSLLQDFAFTR